MLTRAAIIEVFARGSSAIANVCAAAAVCQRFDFPTYYVSGPLFESMKHTNPPAGMTWAEVMFPYDGLVFMVPRGHLHEPGDMLKTSMSLGNTPQAAQHEIMLIGIAKLKGGETYTAPGTKTHIQPPSVADMHDRICIFWSVAPNALVKYFLGAFQEVGLKAAIPLKSRSNLRLA